MSEKTRGPVSNHIFIFRGDELIKKFTPETGTEGAKNPMQQAKVWLNGIASNKEDKLYDDVMGEKLTMVSGHPTTIAPQQKVTF